MNKIEIIKNQKRGQGLLEAIIALGIITTGIIAMITLAISNQSSSIDTHYRLIASNLAREGIEAARFIRDTNWAQRKTVWDEGIYAGGDKTAVPQFDRSLNLWTFNYTPNNISDSGAIVWRNSGVYYQASSSLGGTDSGFRRLLTLDDICTDWSIKIAGAVCPTISGVIQKIGIRVTSRVQWTIKGQIYNLSIEERLFNWRRPPQ